MKKRLVLATSAVLLLSTQLVAANVNGFENFVLSRNDFKSAQSLQIADFSSRTRTVDAETILRFNSGKPCGIMVIIK